MRDRYLDTIESKPIGYYRSNEICGTNRKIGLQPITRRRKSRVRMRKLLYPIDGHEAFSCNITCCTSSVPRGIALIPYFTIGYVKSVPTLLLYGPANYNDKFITADG